ncbi:hypothetical protein L1987_15308 [Smallanthus sonchifolius]|uniref:Uncharacterized protein n=1 Tax=Smallanthus sonchifolius TaxID=185202 RepID=A0ACB9J680_9ASTR|nr:hypothetical protein L1987_15308 [Smallanthus sonchifolius]
MIASESLLVSSLCCAPGSGCGLLISMLGGMICSIGPTSYGLTDGKIPQPLTDSKGSVYLGTVRCQAKKESASWAAVWSCELCYGVQASIPRLGLTPFERLCHLRQRAAMVRVVAESDFPPVAKLGVRVRADDMLL